mgnify:CR=1 FL=1
MLIDTWLKLRINFLNYFWQNLVLDDSWPEYLNENLHKTTLKRNQQVLQLLKCQYLFKQCPQKAYTYVLCILDISLLIKFTQSTRTIPDPASCVIKMVFFFRKFDFFFKSPKRIFQKTILNFKFKIPAQNSIMLWAGILNFKFRTVFWNIFFLEIWRFEKRITL